MKMHTNPASIKRFTNCDHCSTTGDSCIGEGSTSCERFYKRCHGGGGGEGEQEEKEMEIETVKEGATGGGGGGGRRAGGGGGKRWGKRKESRPDF